MLIIQLEVEEPKKALEKGNIYKKKLITKKKNYLLREEIEIKCPLEEGSLL